MTHTENVTIAPQPLDAWFLELLNCPGCSLHPSLQLSESQEALLCPCGRYAFPVREGIPILIVEEATVLNPNVQPGEGVSPPAAEKPTGETA